MTTDLQYQFGLTESLRSQAALLYDQAFGAKFSVAIKDTNQRIALLSKALLLPYAVTAVASGKLVGLAGFQTPQGSLTKGITIKMLFKELGLMRGLRATLIFSLFEREAQATELLMDGIAVAAEARGHGIGSTLLNELKAYAKEHGYQQIRLDVIDTNPRARQLYERHGFKATEIVHFRFLKGLLGFSAATTMIYKVA
ncbi:MAG: GNAT family N-acetyltransferase [Bacteroidota bacterium]